MTLREPIICILYTDRQIVPFFSYESTVIGGDKLWRELIRIVDAHVVTKQYNMDCDNNYVTVPYINYSVVLNNNDGTTVRRGTLLPQIVTKWPIWTHC